MIKIKSYLKALTPSVRKPAVIVSQIGLLRFGLFFLTLHCFFGALYYFINVNVLKTLSDKFCIVGTILCFIFLLELILSFKELSISSIFKSFLNVFRKS